MVRLFLASLLCLFVFVGCSSAAEQPQESLAEIVPYELAHIPEPEESEPEQAEEVNQEKISVMIDRRAFTSTQAKTNEYFFFTFREGFGDDAEFALYQLPLNDIAQGRRVHVPGDGEIEIVGLCEDYLFVSRRSGDHFLRHYYIYRISLSTLEAQVVGEGIYSGVPFFHAPSNSILLSYRNLDESLTCLEAFHINTGQHRKIYEFEDLTNSLNSGWWKLECGGVVFISSSWGAFELGSEFIFIDTELQAKKIERGQILNAPPTHAIHLEAQNPAEEFILSLETVFHNVNFGSFVTIDEWVYYLWSDEGWGRFGNDLHRIRVDGTQNTLLQRGMYAYRLFNINDNLFATIVPQPPEGESGVYQQAVKLSADGSIEKMLGNGIHGHNSGFSIQALEGTDLVLVMQLNFFTVDGWVLYVYCTTTGTLFRIGD